MNYDFTKKELDYILENANFTEEQEKIFKMLTSRYGRATIVNISLTMNMSESTVKRRNKLFSRCRYRRRKFANKSTNKGVIINGKS